MLVMKFGGTSMGSGERIAGVAEMVEARLAGLATGVALLGDLSARTTDAVCAAGELLSAVLVSAALFEKEAA